MKLHCCTTKIKDHLVKRELMNQILGMVPSEYCMTIFAVEQSLGEILGNLMKHCIIDDHCPGVEVFAKFRRKKPNRGLKLVVVVKSDIYRHDYPVIKKALSRARMSKAFSSGDFAKNGGGIGLKIVTLLTDDIYINPKGCIVMIFSATRLKLKSPTRKMLLPVE